MMRSYARPVPLGQEAQRGFVTVSHGLRESAACRYYGIVMFSVLLIELE